MRYKVLNAEKFDARNHRKGTVGHDGKCSLHGCGEPAVATMTCSDSGGSSVVLAVCERGIEEYGLRARFNL